MPVETNISCESIENKDDNNWDQVINNLFNQISQSKQSDGSHEVDANEEDLMSDSQSGGGEINFRLLNLSNLFEERNHADKFGHNFKIRNQRRLRNNLFREGNFFFVWRFVAKATFGVAKPLTLEKRETIKKNKSPLDIDCCSLHFDFLCTQLSRTKIVGFYQGSRKF
jgi:hypothetical protein